MIHALLQFCHRYKLRRFRQVRIDPTAKVNYRGIRWQAGSELTIGEGTIITGQIVAERDHVRIRIGKNTFIGGSSIIAAHEIEIGDDVLIAWGCYLVDHNSHSIHFWERRSDVTMWYRGKKDWSSVPMDPLRVMQKAWIGFNSIVLKGVTIGEGSVVGAGSVVTHDVPPYTVVAGNPARVIKEVSSEGHQK